MRQRLVDFIKKILPPALIVSVQKFRKKRRQIKRFQINEGKDLILPVEILGKKFSIFINPFLNGGVDDDIYHQGVWEPEIAAVISQYLPTGGTFIDIGANIGFHTLFAATLVGDQGSVIAFEPLPRLQEQLRKSAQHNQFTQIKIEPVALAAKEGSALLSLVEENIGASSLQDVTADRAVGSQVSVPVKTLDAYQATIAQLDFIKIDIEGSEYEALQGAESLIRRFMPVIVLEFSPHVYEKDYPGKSLRLYEYLRGLGYSVAVVGDESLDVEKELRTGQLAILHVNLICLPKKSLETAE